MTTDAVAFTDLTAAMTALAVTVGTLEWIAQHRTLQDSGMLSWEVGRLRSRSLCTGIRGALLDVALCEANYMWVLRSRLLLAIAAGIPLMPTQLRGVLWLMAFVSLVLGALRNPYALDGADQQTMLLTLSLAGGFLVGTDYAYEVAMAFLAAQLVLCYVVAGVSKLLSPAWRSGNALAIISRTRTYGSESVYRWLVAHPQLAGGAAWTIMLCEASVIVVLLLPELGWLWIAAMLAFHVGAAITMGLNTFALAFAAAYPSAVYCLTTMS